MGFLFVALFNRRELLLRAVTAGGCGLGSETDEFSPRKQMPAVMKTEQILLKSFDEGASTQL